MDNLKDEFTAISIDESFFFFFFYDSLVREVWIREDERPVIRISNLIKNQSCLVQPAQKESNCLDSMTGLMQPHFLII